MDITAACVLYAGISKEYNRSILLQANTMSEKKRVSNFTLFSESGSGGESFPDRLFGALWLISLGGIFFLNTTGVLPWGIWADVFISLAKLWPIFLIAVGISIIVGDSLPAKIISGVLWYLVFAAIFATALIQYSPEHQTSWENFPDSFVEEVQQNF